MDGSGDRCDVLLEEAGGVGVRQHDARHVGVECLAQRGEVDESALIGRDRGDLVPAQGGGGRVRPMRRVRDQDPTPTIAVRLVVRGHQQQARQLAGRTGRGLQRGCCHPRHLAQGVLELDHQLEPTLRHARRRSRVDVRQAGHRRDRVAQLGVVLHGAGPERVGPEVDRELPVAQPGEVGNQISLRHLGDVRR